ncbi:MAG TPA: sigma-70 family RNA polymerase sigma factor [Vicinamibacteria bacterium]|nr:sigma-70 family RNA polymerase sigma factor [Vicinamibacteria bacterium]
MPPDDPAGSRRDALARALVEHGDRLYSLALRVTRDPDLASDAVQEAFATALQRIDDFRGESRIGTWLHRIVYTKAIDLLRARGRDTPLPEEDGAPRAPEDQRMGGAPTWSRPPDEILFGSETKKALEKAVMELTPLQRLVFELREVEGRATDEVADILSLPPGTVRVHLHRARMRLRALLAHHFRGAVA